MAFLRGPSWSGMRADETVGDRQLGGAQEAIERERPHDRGGAAPCNVFGNAMSSPVRGSHYSERIPALDGIRGLAILMVLFFHFTSYGGWSPNGFLEKAYFRAATAGWAGVDLFFVLSGFLITGILFDTRNSGRFFQSFYARRILRIFPLYYAVLVVFFLVIPLLFDVGADYTQPQSDQVWYWTYLINVKFSIDGWGHFIYLGHFWSLAVEEQFYLLWPLVVFSFPRRTLIRICYTCIAGALALRIGIAHMDVLLPSHLVPRDVLLPAYVLMPARMDALAAGALVALYRRNPQPTLNPRRSVAVLLASGTVLCALLLVLRRFPPTVPATVTVGYSALAAFFAATINLTLQSPSGSRVDRALSAPVLRFLGRYSYALYVFHHPVVLWMRGTRFNVSELPLLFGSRLPAQAAYFLVCLGVSLALALLSWSLIESPFLRLKRAFPYGLSEHASPAEGDDTLPTLEPAGRGD